MSMPGFLARLATTLVVLGAVTSVAVAVADREVWPRSAWHQDRYKAVAAYLREHSAPDARIFVWGNSPEIYLYARRRMASRYPSVNYQTGRVWGTPANEVGARGYRDGVPEQAWDNLMADLDRNAPEFIVDAAAGRLDKMDDEAIGRYPRMAGLLSRHYDLVASPLGVPIYRRK